jgi:hypothetical protein
MSVAQPAGDGSAVLEARADAAIREALGVLDETRERWARLAREAPDHVEAASRT